MGASAELWQTLGVEQRPRATLVGRELQTHAYVNKEIETNVMSDGRPLSGCEIERATPVGGLVGTAAQIDGKLSEVSVCARQHGEQLHEVHGPHVTLGPAVGLLLQAEFGHRCLELSGQS